MWWLLPVPGLRLTGERLYLTIFQWYRRGGPKAGRARTGEVDGCGFGIDSGGSGGAAAVVGSGNFFADVTNNVVTAAYTAQTQAMLAQSQAMVGQVGAQAVKVEAENLQQFKNKVDAILQGLDGSPASHTNISQQQLQPQQLGANFGQASDLANAYNQVHANLEQLSKTLALQIQAMSMSVDMAAKGYQNADEEQKAAFQSVLNQAAGAAQAPVGGAGYTAAGGGSYANPVAYGGGSYGTAAPSGPPAAGANQGGGYA